MGLQQTFKTSFARELINDLEIGTGNQYFLFFGKEGAWTNENSPPSVVDCNNARFDAYRNAFALKRIDKANAFHVVARYDWVSEGIYDEYDDTVDLSAKQYYVMTDEYKIYKCISNNNGAKSTTKPTHTEPEIRVVGDDGYRWKFIGVVTEFGRTYLTDEYIPIENLTSASGEDERANQLLSQQRAVNGRIDEVKVTTNSATFKMATIPGDTISVISDVVGTTDPNYNAGLTHGVTIGLPADQLETVQIQNFSDFVGHDIFTVSGRGPDVGQRRRIKAVYSAGAGVAAFGDQNTTPYAVLTEPFSYSLQSAGIPTRFRVLPPVTIDGDGINVDARTEINSSKQISDVIILNGGLDYTTANVSFPISGTGTAPTGRVIIGPKGGHGARPIDELQSTDILLVLSFIRDEEGKLRTANQFRQFGIIKNPLLNDGTKRVAGREFATRQEMSVSKPFGITAAYRFVDDIASYKPGNFILGQETLSTAKIVDFRDNVGTTTEGTLVLDDIRGSFNVGDPNRKLLRYVFGVSGAISRNAGATEDAGGSLDFVIGEKITQHSASSIFGKNDAGTTGSTAEGTVISWNPASLELIVEETSNSFTDSLTAGYVLGGTVGYITFNRFENAGGELIKQFSVGDTLGSGNTAGKLNFFDVQGTTEGVDLENYGRAMSLVIPDTDENRNPIYVNTTKLLVKSSDETTNLAADRFQQGATLSQGEGSKIARGDVLEWFTFGGTTGEIHLTNVSAHGFANSSAGWTAGGTGGDFITPGVDDPSGLSAAGTAGISGESNLTVYEVTKPEIEPASGEVLYIENIRPTTRNIEQEEEFKILIGF